LNECRLESIQRLKAHIEFTGLREDLSDALGVTVDLVMKDALKRGIGRRILSEAVML
jgi:uncharacterized protein